MGCCNPAGTCAEACEPNDGGTEDAGTTDAGEPVDAGQMDAGQADAGVPDAGVGDAGPIDSGMTDAGTSDAGLPDGGKVDAGGFISDGGLLCTAEGWCWLNPRPQGDPINDIHGTGPADVWAVTEGGNAIHWNGASWTMHELTPKYPLEGIWAASANDVWAVGRGVHHWNGTSWTADAGNTSVFTQNVNAIWGSAPNDIWAVGDFSTVKRFNGSAWTSVTNVVPFSSELLSIKGRNANDVHVVGQGGAFSSFNGTTWTNHSGFGGGWIYAVWPAAANDVWVVGAGKADRWNGTTRTPFSEAFANFEAAWGSAPNDVWLGGTGSSNDFRHWDGTTLSEVTPARQGVKALWGTAQNDVWVGGYGGRLGHFDGAAWSDVSTRYTAQMAALFS